MLRVHALTFSVGRVEVSAHVIFESLSYAVGFWLYRRDRMMRGDPVGESDRSSVIVAAILGAAIGSKLLACFEDPSAIWGHPLNAWFAGKTIVGGLLGGTMAVEFVKARLGIRVRTGDLFAIPIAVGAAIGRVGCFFGGIQDHTYGVVANVPWAVDFGDGLPRHPVQLYEVIFLLALAALLAKLGHSSLRNGDLFRIFLASYLAWRFVIDFLKPEPVFFGLSSIQWACAAALLWYGRDIARIWSQRKEVSAHG
jgi:prolipoprotein diacylglyceryltransferase